MYPIRRLSIVSPQGGPALVMRNPLFESEIWLVGVAQPQRESSEDRATPTTLPKKPEERSRPKISLEQKIYGRAKAEMYFESEVLRSMLLLGRLKNPAGELTVTLHPDGKISLSEPVYTPSGVVWDTRSLEAEWQKCLKLAREELSTLSDPETESGGVGSDDSAE